MRFDIHNYRQETGRRIFEARIKKGWSRPRLAEEIRKLGYEINEKTIERVELNSYDGHVKVDNIHKMRLALGMKEFPIYV